MSPLSRCLALAALIPVLVLVGYAQTPPPPPPQALQGGFHEGAVLLSWMPPPDVMGHKLYVIYRSEDSVKFSPVGEVWDTLHFRDWAINLNSFYFYYVTVVIPLDSMESGPSNVIGVPTGSEPGPPQPPNGLMGFPYNGNIVLKWHVPDYPVEPSGYHVYRRGHADTGFVRIGEALKNTFEDDSVGLNSVYAYYVTALYGDTGESGPSNIVEVHSGKPAPPVSLDGHIEEGKAFLVWKHPENDAVILFYKVYRWTWPAPDTLPAVIGQSGITEFVDSIPDIYHNYSYFVTAVYQQDSTESSWSNLVFLSGRSAAVTFTSSPPTTAHVHQIYGYDADAITDPPGLNVCFSLDHAPDGMSIDKSTGLIQWAPKGPGVFGVEVHATICDTLQGDARQEFHIAVFSGEPGSVAGTVQNDEGRGLGLVTVNLFDVVHGEFVMHTRTDDSGHYRFPLVNASTYFVRARPDSLDLYAPQWYDGVQEVEKATPVTVPESTSVEVNFTLHPAKTFHQSLALGGTVLDSLQAPIAGARIAVFRILHDQPIDALLDGDSEDHDLVLSTFSKLDGSYQMVLPEGHYIVAALKEGYFPQFWDHKSSPLEASIINLTQDTSGIDFDLRLTGPAGGILHGTLFSASDSTRLRGLVVGFHKFAPDSAFSGMTVFTNTDQDGNYFLSGMPQGYYVVLALPRGQFVPTFYNTFGGTPFHEQATPVAVFADSVGGIDIYAQPDSICGLNSIAGHVNAGLPAAMAAPLSLTPVAGAVVTLIDASTNSPVASAITQGDGSYAAAGLAPGTYSVVFQKPGKTTSSVPVTIGYTNYLPTMMTVDAQLADAPGGSGQIGVMTVQPRWNLLSLPVDLADRHADAVFPGAGSPAFRYDAGSGYVQSDILDNDRGYWLKFRDLQAFTLPGSPRSTQSISLSAGWNLIGSLSVAIPATSVTTSPPGIIASHFFTYRGSYSPETSLLPGMGYWVKASSAGTLTLNSGAAVPKNSTGGPDGLANLSSITIRDAAGNSQTLYFGSAAAGGMDPAKCDLPPAAPGDAFDVRFASGRFAELAFATQAVEYPILLQSLKAPVTVSWSIKEEGSHWSLQDSKGAGVGPATLSGTGSAQTPETGRLVLIAGSRETPKEFALLQNYPNPFNPATHFEYRIANPGLVTLKVYDVLGQEVATLVNEVKQPGEYTIDWDATSQPSGVYFYRLQAGPFVATKKLGLIR